MLKQEIIKAKIILHNSIFLAINNVIHVTYYWGSEFLISIKIDGFTTAQSKMNISSLCRYDSFFRDKNNVIRITYYCGSKFIIGIKTDGFTIVRSKMK